MCVRVCACVCVCVCVRVCVSKRESACAWKEQARRLGKRGTFPLTTLFCFVLVFLSNVKVCLLLVSHAVCLFFVCLF